jgi:hypothetical protein
VSLAIVLTDEGNRRRCGELELLWRTRLDVAMRIPQVRSPQVKCVTAVLGLAVLASGCGGSSSSSSTASSSASGTSSQAASASSSTTSAPKLRLPILAPKAGARTGSVLTVRVALIGGRATGANPFRYVLDGTDVRRGSRTLVFHGLAPGHHHLVVMLAAHPGVRGTRLFVVKTPPAPPPAPVVTMTSAAPAPPPVSTPAPAPAPAPPAAGNGIPQGGGGDGDSDNNGGPSDGDGNI